VYQLICFVLLQTQPTTRSPAELHSGAFRLRYPEDLEQRFEAFVRSSQGGDPLASILDAAEKEGGAFDSSDSGDDEECLLLAEGLNPGALPFSL
jgi:hypothetical protein